MFWVVLSCVVLLCCLFVLGCFVLFCDVLCCGVLSLFCYMLCCVDVLFACVFVRLLVCLCCFVLSYVGLVALLFAC